MLKILSILILRVILHVEKVDKKIDERAGSS